MNLQGQVFCAQPTIHNGLWSAVALVTHLKEGLDCKCCIPQLGSVGTLNTDTEISVRVHEYPMPLSLTACHYKQLILSHQSVLNWSVG